MILKGQKTKTSQNGTERFCTYFQIEMDFKSQMF